VDFALTTERLGERFYQRLANKFSQHAEIAAAFTRLARDEHTHAAQFAKLLDAVEAEKDDRLEYEREQVLRVEALQAFFSRAAGPLKGAEEVEDVADALQRAYAFEVAAAHFYQSLREELGAMDVLDELVEAEKEHARALMKVMVAGAEFRSLRDDWH